MGAILGSIGIPLAIEAVKKLTGSGIKKKNKKKSFKKGSRFASRQKQPIQGNTINRRHSIKPKFLKTTPISNFEIMKWIKYFKIKNFKVISRDEIALIKKNHSYICNLDDFEGNGTHWVAIAVNRERDKILYFDSFGLRPPQNLRGEYIYNSTQYQHLKSTTCGYFCLYFINEIRYKSYEDVVKPFSHTDKHYNESFIQNYFE